MFRHCTSASRPPSQAPTRVAFIKSERPVQNAVSAVTALMKSFRRRAFEILRPSLSYHRGSPWRSAICDSGDNRRYSFHARSSGVGPRLFLSTHRLNRSKSASSRVLTSDSRRAGFVSVSSPPPDLHRLHSVTSLRCGVVPKSVARRVLMPSTAVSFGDSGYGSPPAIPQTVHW